MKRHEDIYLDSGKPLTFFLDIDGVFNKPINHMRRGFAIDQDCIMNLQYLIDRYDASVCWISSWRRSFDTDQLFNVFIGANLRVAQDRRLPNLPLPDERDDFMDYRGPIIERYCAEHGINLEEIIIIDDDGPKTLEKRWVKTNCYDGFTYSRTLEVERILNGWPNSRDPLGTLLPGFDPRTD